MQRYVTAHVVVGAVGKRKQMRAVAFGNARKRAEAARVRDPVIGGTPLPIRAAVAAISPCAIAGAGAQVEVNAPVVKLGGGGLVGGDDLAARPDPLAKGPGAAVVLARQRGHDGRPMLARGHIVAGGHQPYGYQQRAVRETDAVPGAERKAGALLGGGKGGDIPCLAPRAPVILGDTLQHAAAVGGIILAIKKVDAPVLALHHHGVVDGGVLLRAAGKCYRCGEAVAAVLGAREENVHHRPILGGAACLVIGKQRTGDGDEHAGNAVLLVLLVAAPKLCALHRLNVGDDLLGDHLLLLLGAGREGTAALAEVKAKLVEDLLLGRHHADLDQHGDDAVGLLLDGLGLLHLPLGVQLLDLNELVGHKVVGAADTTVSAHRNTGKEHFVKAVVDHLVGEGGLDLLQREEVGCGKLDAGKAVVAQKFAKVLGREGNAGEVGDVVNDHGEVDLVYDVKVILFDLGQAELVVEGGNRGDGVVAELLHVLCKADRLVGRNGTDVAEQLGSACGVLGNDLVNKHTLLLGEQERLARAAANVEAGNALLQIEVDEVAKCFFVDLVVFVKGGEKRGKYTAELMCHSYTSFRGCAAKFHLYCIIFASAIKDEC